MCEKFFECHGSSFGWHLSFQDKVHAHFIANYCLCVAVQYREKATLSLLAVTTNADGTLVEEGLAIQITGTADWVYTTKEVNPNLSGDQITITATDNPANLTTSGQILT
jgi:hypothetical protein